MIYFANSSRVAKKTPDPSWFRSFNPKPFARVRLFCFPYAGGDALTIFRGWPKMLPEAVEVCPVQIAGRGTRVSEAPFTSLLPSVETIGKTFEPYLDKPFVFFGHSMGAMMAFELARLLRREYGIEPKTLFVSGRQAPHIPDTDPPTYNLEEPEFLEELKRIGGTPEDALNNPELMKLMLPILKADFQVCQTHTHVAEPPLNSPIVVLGGLKDKTSREDLEAWRSQTSGRLFLHLFPGGHFFIRTDQNAVLRMLFSYLSEMLARLES